MKGYLKVMAIAFGLAAVMLSGCGAAETTQSDDNNELLNIYTTLYPLEFFANEIGGSYVEVVSILPAGADAHTYEPTSKTMVDIAGADAFIYHGSQLEAYADTITAVLDEENVPTLEASAGVSLLEHVHEEDVQEENEAHEDHEHEESVPNEAEHNHDEEHSHGNADPHIWLDPVRSIALAENIKNSLIELKPEAEEEFESNFADLVSELEKLDEEFHNKLASQERNKILVTHAAYGYWEQAYGIEQVAISGISPSEEPSQKQLERVIDVVKEYQINYLLFEQNVTPKVATVIQGETNVKPLHIHNLAALTEEDINNDEDYFTLMYQNLDTLVTALED